MIVRCLRVVIALFLLTATVGPVRAEEWRSLAPGLELREFLMPDRVGDLSGEQGVLAVLRINPACYAFSLGSALETGTMLTVGQWSRRLGFTAAINAGMFRADDRLRATGYMRDGDLMVNDFVHPGYGAFLLFGPKDPALPRVRWVDRKQDPDWQAVIGQYQGAIQNYRLISHDRQNLWTQDEPRHSAAAIGMDQDGRVLFIHCRTGVSMREFTQTLLDLPLDLVGAMYVEGGADAAMYVDASGFTGRWVGEYRSDFFQGSNKNFWPVPNVLGIRPK